MVVDELDLRLLAQISLDPPASARQLSAAIQEPPSTIDLRLRRLRQQQVIVGYGYTVDVQAIGFQSYRLLLYAREMHVKLRQDLYKYCLAHRNICAFVECLGSWDFEIVAEVSGAREIVGLTQNIRETFGERIEQIKLLPSFRLAAHSRYIL